MREDVLRHWIGRAVLGVEVLAVAVIVSAIVVGLARFLSKLGKRAGGDFEGFKRQTGRSLLLGLELLVAADIIQSVIAEQNLEYLKTLGFLVIIRTFLSWSMLVEMEGRWPWEPRGARAEKADD